MLKCYECECQCSLAFCPLVVILSVLYVILRLFEFFDGLGGISTAPSLQVSVFVLIYLFSFSADSLVVSCSSV